MTKTDKLPRVIEVSDGHYAVSIGDDVTVQWWKSKNGVWSVQVKAETAVSMFSMSTTKKRSFRYIEKKRPALHPEQRASNKQGG